MQLLDESYRIDWTGGVTVRVVLEQQEFYSRKYIIEGAKDVGSGAAYLFVEICDKSDFPEDGDYSISAFIGREKMAVREFCIGYIFGKRPLSL